MSTPSHWQPKFTLIHFSLRSRISSEIAGYRNHECQISQDRSWVTSLLCKPMSFSQSVYYSILQKLLKAFSPNLGETAWCTRTHMHPLWDTLEGLRGMINSPEELRDAGLWCSKGKAAGCPHPRTVHNSTEQHRESWPVFTNASIFLT